MKGKKGFLSAGALFMGLIVLLGVMGIVSGLWSKNLVIHGVVETGDVNADWDCGYTNDDGAEIVIQGAGCDPEPTEATGDIGLDPNAHDWPGFTDADPFVAKDVGNCELSFDEQAPFGYQEAFVKITNAYPSYECTISLFLTNTGSIPVNVISAELKLPPDAQGVLETVDASGDDQCDPSVLLNGDPQVDPGEEKQLDCTVHVAQVAEQSTCTAETTSTNPVRVGELDCDPIVSYEFAIDVCVAQWNEAATAEECKNSEEHEGPPETTFAP